jgi:Phage integrase family
MATTQVANEVPMAVNVTVGKRRRKEHPRSAKSSPREYLTEKEIEKLMDAARANRWGHRDATAILLAYRHGLHASELVALRWDDIDFTTGKLRVRRAPFICSIFRGCGPEHRFYQPGDGCDCCDLDEHRLYGDDRGCCIYEPHRNCVARDQVQSCSGKPGIARRRARQRPGFFLHRDSTSA